MEISITIALIALAGTIINAWFVKSSSKHMNTAAAKKANAEADEIVYNFKNQVILEMQIQIDQLKKEIELLKSQELIHIQEKVRLEEKLELVIEENKTLKEQMYDNKLHYEEDVQSLREQIKKLKNDLSKYKKA